MARDAAIRGGAPLISDPEGADAAGSRSGGSTSRVSPRRRLLLSTAKVLLAIGLLAFLLGSGRVDLRLLLAIDRPGDVLLAQLLWIVAFLFTVVRWHLLLRSLDVPHRPIDALRLCGLGMFFSQVIPGATGGDLVRGVQIARESPGRRAPAVLSVLLDRALGLSALMLLGVLGVFLAPAQLAEHPLIARLRIVLLALLGGVAVVAVLLSIPALWRGDALGTKLARLPGGRILASLVVAIGSMRARRRTLAAGLLASLLAHSIFVGTAFFLSRALTAETPSYPQLVLLVPLGQLAFSLPLTPGGTGVGQWAYDELFTAVGSTHGGELGVLLQLTSVGWGILGVVALFHGGRDLQRALEETQTSVQTDAAGSIRSARGPEDPTCRP